MKTNSQTESAAGTGQRGEKADAARRVREVVRRSARRPLQSVRAGRSLVLPTFLAFGTVAVCGQSLGVFQSVFPTETRLGSACSASGAVFNTSTGTVNSVLVTLTASPSGEFRNLMAFPLSVTYTSVAPNHVVFDVGDLTASQSTSLAYDFVADHCDTYSLDLVATASNAPPASNTTVVVIIEPFSGYYLAGAQMPAVAEPVSGFSGKEVFTEPPDFDLGGPGLPIVFRRHYDGALFEDGVVNSALGPNWLHDYDITLSLNDTNATVGFHQGRILRFENDGANWNLTERLDIPFRLVESGPDFILGDPRSQIMYFFQTNGLLTRIEDGRGNTNFLSYSGTLLTNVNDGLGRSLTLTYDGGGQLTNVTDGVRSVGFTHGSPLASVVDALGFVTSYSYTNSTNNPALLTARTLPEGNTSFTQFYNEQNRVSAQTDGAGNTTTFGYGPAIGGRETAVTNPLGHVTIQLHTADGEFNQFTDQAGKSIFIQQEFNTGRRSSVRDRHNILTRIFYEATNGFPNRIDLPSSPDEFFDYAPRVLNGITFFDLIRARHPDGTTNAYAHDAQGNLIGETNRVGDVWRYGRNSHGQLLSVTNPLGGTASFAYDAGFRLVSSTDSDVGVTTYEYDSLNRLTNLTHPNPTTLRFAYDALDRLTSVTDERTNTTVFQYDGNSRLTNIVDALTQITRFEYDALDRLVRTVDRLGQPTSVGYDPRSLVSSVTNRNGFVTRFEYDARQRLTGIINPGGATNSFSYDDEGLLVAASNPLGHTARLERDPMGYVTNLFDQHSNKVTLVRDAMKRITSLTDSLGRATTFAYDRRGLLTNVIRQLGIAATYHYNALGLVTNLTDPKPAQWNFAYTLAGRMTNLADPLGRTTSLEYDVRGRRSRIVHPDGVTQTNTFDGVNNLIRVQYSDGTDLRYAFDALNRLTNAQGSPAFDLTYDAEDRPTNTRQDGLDFGAAWDADGRLTNVTYNSGALSVTYVYDSRDRVVHVSDNLTGEGMGFDYDAADRLTSITRSNGITTTYTYDARGFVTRIQEGSIIDIHYTIDAAGQVTEADYVTVPLDPAASLTNESASFTYDAASQLNSAGYAYDPRGRLTNAPNTAFQWDGASRLIGIDAVSLGYNALDDIVTRVEGGTTNRYFCNYALGGLPIVAERNDNTGQFTRYYVWSPGGLLLYIVNLPGNTISYVHCDHVGSTLALTAGNGSVTDTYAYDPYGKLLAKTGSNPQPFQFVGRLGVRAEPAGNLSHMRARYYDPRTARFISPEPIWPVLVNPKKLNPYQYALQDPLGLIDPEGTDEKTTLKSLEKMEEKELEKEIVDRIVQKNKERLEKENPTGRKDPRLTKDELKDLRKATEEQLKKEFPKKLGKKPKEKREEDLRKKLQELRDEEAAKQKAEEEAKKKAAEKAARPPVPLPGGVLVPVPPKEDPYGGFQPPPPPRGGYYGGDDDDDDDDGYRGFVPAAPFPFGFGDNDSSFNSSISTFAPAEPSSPVLLQPKPYNLIWGDDGALKYQGPRSGAGGIISDPGVIRMRDPITGEIKTYYD